MSCDSAKHHNIQDENLTVTYNKYDYEEYFYACDNITTSVVKDIRHVKNDWTQLYKDNKHELNDLNERLRLFLNSLQLLEQENIKFTVDINAFRKQMLSFVMVDESWNESYLSLQTNLNTFANQKFESESEIEFNQLQIQVYEQLYKVFQLAANEQCSKLEHELQQLSAVLINLKSSYQTSEKEIGELRISLESAIKQYFVLIHEKCQIKAQQKQLKFNTQLLRNQITYHKSLYAYAYQETEKLFGVSTDSELYWSIEFDKCVERIRHDFGCLYASIQRSVLAYYDEKSLEMRSELEHTVQYQQSTHEEFLLIQKSLQIECEQTEASLLQQKEIQVKYEAELAKLEADWKEIQLYHEKKFEEQQILLTNGQEEILVIGQSIGEIRRSTITLQTEIIVYRHLLENTSIRQCTVLLPTSEITEKVVVVNESKREGAIGIKECAASGKYISLINHSTNQDIDLSSWTVKRRFDSSSDIVYTIPNGTWLKHGKELTIYSKLGTDALESPLCSRTVAFSCEELIAHDLASWGMGNAVETILIDRNGDEKASHIQSLGFGTGHVYIE